MAVFPHADDKAVLHAGVIGRFVQLNKMPVLRQVKTF
jgi:hypothetical protein